VLHQPDPSELVRNVVRAATNLSPRTVINPWAGYQYLATLTSRLVALNAGLVLRVLHSTAKASDASSDRSNVRFTD
jgi:hypothetical protein